MIRMNGKLYKVIKLILEVIAEKSCCSCRKKKLEIESPAKLTLLQGGLIEKKVSNVAHELPAVVVTKPADE